MDKWFNKLAIVTGASAGIGKDISIRLVSYGLKVVGCGRNFDTLLKVKNDISINSKGEFIPFQCDVSKEEDVLKMFDFVKTNYKELSILINNAGFAEEGSILHGKTDNWRSMFETNVLGYCICAREAYALMKLNETLTSHVVPGHIVNINSVAGHGVPEVTFLHFYSSTKFAITAITESIRQELREARSNIKVTQISPSFVETNFNNNSANQAVMEIFRKLVTKFLEPSDVSDAIILALSAEARCAVHDIMLKTSANPA